MAKPLTFLTRTALASFCAALTVSSFAQTSPRLSTETPAWLAPNENAAVLRILPAGSELNPASAPTELPATWQAITLDGPFTLYVRNGDIDKGLAIKPASPLYLEPDNAAAVVAYAAEGDAITITGLRGRWTQIELQKPLTAYVSAKSGNAPATTNETAPAISTLPVPIPSPAKTVSPTASDKDATVELPEEPEALTAEIEATTPQLVSQVETVPEPTVETVAIADVAPATRQPPQAQYKPALNRSQIQGKLVSTRKRFGARRPYDWQINAKFSFRIAYLDFSRIQGTDQLARYEGRQVVVYGLVSPLGDGQYVMEVESIRLQ